MVGHILTFNSTSRSISTKSFFCQNIYKPFKQDLFHVYHILDLIDWVSGIVGVVGKKYKNLIAGGRGGGGLGLEQWGVWKKLKFLIVGGRVGWLLNSSFLSFFNHKNYSINNVCVCNKSKIKTKVTSKQNL